MDVLPWESLRWLSCSVAMTWACLTWQHFTPALTISGTKAVAQLIKLQMDIQPSNSSSSPKGWSRGWLSVCTVNLQPRRYFLNFPDSSFESEQLSLHVALISVISFCSLLLAYAMTCFLLPCTWQRTAPSLKLLASISKINESEKSA